MNLFLFIFDFLKSFKLIKKSQKGGIFRACTRGCDVALGAHGCNVDATWTGASACVARR